MKRIDRRLCRSRSRTLVVLLLDAVPRRRIQRRPLQNKMDVGRVFSPFHQHLSKKYTERKRERKENVIEFSCLVLPADEECRDR